MKLHIDNIDSLFIYPGKELNEIDWKAIKTHNFVYAGAVSYDIFPSKDGNYDIFPSYNAFKATRNDLPCEDGMLDGMLRERIITFICKDCKAKAVWTNLYKDAFPTPRPIIISNGFVHATCQEVLMCDIML